MERKDHPKHEQAQTCPNCHRHTLQWVARLLAWVCQACGYSSQYEEQQ